MNSHERTMLAKFGFADPDRKDELHDLACQYLAQPDVLRKMVCHVAPWGECDWQDHKFRVRIHHEVHIQKGEGRYATTVGWVDAVLRVDDFGWVPEEHWVCCEDQGSVIPLGSKVEFRDGVWCCVTQSGCFPRYEETVVILTPPKSPAGQRVAYRTYGDEKKWLYDDRRKPRGGSHEILVEVKIGEVGMGDVLRQISLYRTYGGRYGTGGYEHALLVTAFPITTAELALLRSKNVHHVQLGASFAAYVEEQRSEQAKAVSVEL